MNCALTPEQHRQLRTKIAGNLSKLGDESFDLKSYIASVHDLIKNTINDKMTPEQKADREALAMDYARLVPGYILQITGVDKDIRASLRKKGLSLDDLSDLVERVENDKKGVQEMTKFLGTDKNIIEEVRDANKIVQEDTKQEVVQKKEDAVIKKNSPTPAVNTVTAKVTPGQEFKAVPPTILADKDQEAKSWDIDNPEYNVIDPTAAFYFKVKRKMIDMLTNAGISDSSELRIPGFGPSGVYLQIAPISKLNEKDLRSGSANLPKDTIVMIIVDHYGNPITFNENGDHDYGGKVAYYNLRSTEGLVNEDGSVILSTEDQESARALARQTGLSIDDAHATIRNQIKLVDDIRKHILKDPKANTVMSIITGGSQGYTYFDFNLNTPISSINFAGEDFNPYPAREDNLVTGEKNGFTYFRLKSMGNQAIEVERPTISQDMAEKLTSLLIDDIQVIDPTGRKKSPITAAERQGYIDAYFYTRKEILNVFVNEDGTYAIRFRGNKMDLSTPASKEAARKELMDYFTGLSPQRKIEKPTKEQISKAITNPSQFKLGSIYKQGDGSYWVVEYPKLNISKDLLTSGAFVDVELLKEGDGLVARRKKAPRGTNQYKQWIRDNFIIHYGLNAKNELLRLNAYLTFEPLEYSLDQVYGRTKPMADLRPIPKVEEKNGPADKKSTDLLDDVWNDPDLQKNLDQKDKDRKATEEQVAAAKVWYENHPMSKHFPFETMFNVINTKGAAATWAAHGITLYRGSDYSDLYHEAWHGFTQAFLTKEQRQSLYSEVRKKSGSFNDFKGKRVMFSKANELQIEEYLAEDFRTFMLTGKAPVEPVRKSIFQRILDFFKALFGDLTADEVNSNQFANKAIYDLYNKLRVGNLSEYTFNVQNASFKNLNFGIVARDVNAERASVDYETSKTIVDSVDSLISEFVDMANAGLSDKDKSRLSEIERRINTRQPVTQEEREELRALKAKQTYKYTSTLIKTTKGKQRAYEYVKRRLSEIHNDFYDKYEKEGNEALKAQYVKKIDTLRWAIDNFGNIDNLSENKDGKDVIGYHVAKSKFLSEEDKEDFFEEKSDGLQRFDRSGNELSLKDLASEEVLYLLRSLHAKRKDGTTPVNEFGIAELAPMEQVWNRTARSLQNIRTPQEMYKRLALEANSYPAFQQLLNKLGPVTTMGTNEFNLWTNFWQTFNKTHIPLVQMTVETITRDDSGTLLPIDKYTYTVRTGAASAEYKKVGQRWNTHFRTTRSEYIKNDDGGNYLDINAVLRDFPERELRGKEFEFFHALGINLDDKKEIHDALRSGIGGAQWIRKALKYLGDRGDVIVRDISDIMKSYDEITIGGRKFFSKKDEFSRYNQLQELQARYSDDHSNFMVTNAEGNTQFEHSLNNSLTVIVNSINDVGSYQELISLQHMSFLDMNRNPWVKGSTWMNSIFDFNTPEGKKRRQSDLPDAPFVKINLSNLSGVALMTDGLMNAEGGIASASADEFTKLILDLHLTVGRGQPELMRHADKGTSFSVSLSNIFSSGKNKTSYVDTVSFIKAKDSASLTAGHNEAFEMILPHISGELARINEMKKMATEGVEDFDFDYLNRGQDFVLFDDVLSPETKAALKKLDMNLDDYLNSETPESENLKHKIYDDVALYFETKVQEATDLLNKAPFISDNMIQKISGEARNKKVFATSNEIKDAIVRSFVYNSWVHNLESLVLFYGDVALYNMKKEEFHKRNAGFGSTGNIFRTDRDAITYINNIAGRGYGKVIGAPAKDFNGTFDTAVVADNKLASKYLEEYKKVIPGAVGAYEEMTEGDAQGWITFDSYRIAAILEGNWDFKLQEKMYQDIVTGKEVPTSEVIKNFPTRKYQYMGYLQGEGLPIVAFHKFSLFPLIPSVIKGTNLEKLHSKLAMEGIDYALFKSGSKVGTITKSGKSDKLYSDDTKREISDAPFTKNTIFMEFLKDQLEIAPKYKGNVTFSTQLRKLVEDGLVEGGVPTDFMPKSGLSERRAQWAKLSESEKMKSDNYRMLKTYESNISKLTEFKKKELLEEANWSIGPDGKPKGNLKDLMEFVTKELQRQDLSDHELEFMDVDPNTNKLVHDLSMSLSADKIERLLNALVVKRLVRQKVNGEGLIQVSGAGFEKTEAYTNPSEKDLSKWGTNDLPFYHKGKDGKTAAMKVKIALQGKFEKLLNLTHKDGEKIDTIQRLNEMLKDNQWLDEKDHRRMITMVGVRIPVQGLNSMEFMEVYEFLPKEAGTIIVPPAEIVAKSGSDFDIDKLTVMMPQYRTIDKQPTIDKQYTKAQIEELYEKYKKAKVESEKALVRDAEGKILGRDEDIEVYNRVVYAIFGVTSEELDSELFDMLQEEGKIKTLDQFTNQFNGSKAIENDLIWNIKEILSLPANYSRLIRPNDVDIVKPLADELSDMVMDYNPKNRVFEGDKKQVSGTRVLEIPYNLYKHSSNNIGKQTLGLGAVDNTYNVLFNRIGAYMNASSGITNTARKAILEVNPNKRDIHHITDLNKYRRQTILLPHNTIETEDGLAISLSHIEDAKGENTISDVISQLINGWVDIAKDAWIFNIQGNKEIAPTLLFMVQAGVPFKSAVYLSSLPLVREYVKQQKLAKSTFAGPLGTAGTNPMFFRNKAREAVLANPKFGFNLTKGQLTGRSLNRTLYDEAVKKTEEVLGENGNFDQAKLLDIIKNYKEGKEPSDYEKAAFLHFIELENMGRAVRDVKMRMNFDTTKSSTLFEAQSKTLLIEQLRSDNRIPTSIVDDLLSGSPISSFYIQPFQVEIWKDLFALRNHPILNDFLANKFRSGIIDDVRGTYGDSEKFANEFRNDLMSFIFQNSFKSFELNTVKSYQGFGIDKTVNIKAVKSLQHAVFVKDGVMYVDKTQLEEDYKTRAYTGSSYLERGLAPIPAIAFESAKEFYRFVFEREALRDVHPFEQTTKSKEFEKFFKLFSEDVVQNNNETEEQYKKRQLGMTYEMWLRDKALDNTYNGWKIFRSENSFADEYFSLIDEFPQLRDSYSVLKNLVMSEAKGYTNLRLADTSLDSDKINVFHENLKELADVYIKKVENAEDNRRVSEFFDRFSVVAFLQSGLNTKSAFSMVRVVPLQKFTSLMEEPVKAYTKYLNDRILQEYYDKFVLENSIQNKSRRVRYKNYAVDMTLSQSLKSSKSDINKTMGSTQELVEYSPGIYTYNPLNIGMEGANNLAAKNLDKVFVYNGATDATGNATTLDRVFQGISTDNKYPLASRKKYTGGKIQEEYTDIALPDGSKVIDPKLKQRIDDAIRSLKELQESGKDLAFSKAGYGQYMIGANEDTGVKPAGTPVKSPASFLYLSEQLYKHFGFINPNYEKTRTGKKVIQKNQEITDEVVRDLMKHCFS